MLVYHSDRLPMKESDMSKPEIIESEIVSASPTHMENPVDAIFQISTTMDDETLHDVVERFQELDDDTVIKFIKSKTGEYYAHGVRDGWRLAMTQIKDMMLEYAEDQVYSEQNTTATS